MDSNNPFTLHILDNLSVVPATEWNALLQDDSGPFVKHEFLSSLEEANCVGVDAGWQVAHLILKSDNRLIGAMPLYLKKHSYGEYVFDWAWAEAYTQHGLQYYPKLLCAIPFTPIQGTRILVHPEFDSNQIHESLIKGLKSLVYSNDLSSAHVLFPSEKEITHLEKQGFQLRNTVQFHWKNQGFQSFEQFLSALTMKRRKNIRHERAMVAKESITFRHIPGDLANDQDWDHFYACYQNTYLEHYSPPYLNREFFQLLAQRMPKNIHLIFAQRDARPIAASLLMVDQKASKVFGRYWGALGRVPCLHFETAYYQAIEYCIAENIDIFEGGAQGEHKMARGFLPTTIQSAHYIQDPRFAKSIELFLQRERAGVANYVDELSEHNPLKSATLPQ